MQSRLEGPQISFPVCHLEGWTNTLAAVPLSHPLSFTVPACLNPAYWQAQRWGDGLFTLFTVVDLKTLVERNCRGKRRLLAKPMECAEWGVAFFFFPGEPKPSVFCCWELFFWKCVESKSRVIGFEMLWGFFFFLDNFKDAAFSATGEDVYPTFGQMDVRWWLWFDALNVSQM